MIIIKKNTSRTIEEKEKRMGAMTPQEGKDKEA